MGRRQKDYVYGVDGPTDRSMMSRVMMRCAEMGMPLRQIAQIWNYDNILVATRCNWTRWLTKRRAGRKRGQYLDELAYLDYDKYIDRIKEIIMNADGKCECCGHHIDDTQPGRDVKNQMCIDHDHKTGEPRAYLCGKCNLGEGLFTDNPEAILSLYKYMTGT